MRAATLVILGLIAVAFAFLRMFDAKERQFQERLAVAASSNAEAVDLRGLFPGPWETVCDSLGYDGPLYVKKYDRTYEPAAPPQDGHWGLIFISADGSYEKASGSCRNSGALVRVNGCAYVGNGALNVQRDSQSVGCIRYTAK